MDALISEFSALNNEEIRNIKIDLEEIIDLVGTGDRFPFALSNLWDSPLTQVGLDYVKNYGMQYAMNICVNKEYFNINLDVLKIYINYYISLLEEEIRV
jgi:hypothetical protein